jgi:hypothetical protein
LNRLNRLARVFNKLNRLAALCPHFRIQESSESLAAMFAESDSTGLDLAARLHLRGGKML